MRDEDIVYRYGGEEFVIILPGASLDAARERALAVSRDVRLVRVETAHAPIKMTISAGVATFPEHGETREQLLVLADKALYLAKQSGRDRVELASVAARS